MTKSAKQTSSTPILDLLQPLSEPYSGRLNRRFAVPFLALVAAIMLTGNFSFLAVPFGFLVINFLATAIHEFGHLTAGWWVGLRFTGVLIAPFVVERSPRGLKFKVRPMLFGGLAFMALDKVRRMRRRLIVYGLGGPLSSIVCGAGAVVAGEWSLQHYDSSWPTFLDFFGAWSIFIGVISLFSSSRASLRKRWPASACSVFLEGGNGATNSCAGSLYRQTTESATSGLQPSMVSPCKHSKQAPGRQLLCKLVRLRR
jgi:hypothetical protein